MDNKKIKMPSYDDSGVIRFGLAILFIVFVIIGGWAAYAPLASSSVAIGKVSADLNKKTVQHLEGGKVTAIYIKDGDKVKKGQLLLKFNDVQIKAQLDILSAQYQDALAKYARLKAQRDQKDKIEFPAELIDVNAKKDENNIFVATKKTIKDEKIITKNRIVQFQKQIGGLNSLIKSKKNRIASLQAEILEWQELYKQRLVDKQRIRDLKREINNVDGDLSSTIAKIAQIREQISEMKNQQLLREKQFKEDILKKYVEAKSLVSDLKAKIMSSKDTLRRTKILAPIGGTIVGFTIHTIGAVIRGGEKILEIVPEDAKLVVIAEVKTTDIDKVKVGLLANISLPAFNMRMIHVIQGRVIQVSADSFVNKANHAQYYQAKVEVTKEGYKYLNKYGFVLLPGMPAQVMIQLGDRSALSYFLKPFTTMLMKSFNEE